MQISNPIISQYLNGTINRAQQIDRLPVKSVTIEGQLLNEDKPQFSPEKIRQDSESQNQSGQLIAPVNPQQNAPEASTNNNANSNANTAGGALLIQKKLGDKQSLTVQSQSSTTEQSFPYGSRRSLQGLAGSSLVVQKYLNNESTTQADSLNGSAQKNIDVFI